ncbi:MAG: hypothetical protein RQ968_05190 [Thermoproteota archaeon]|jgi:hypothetical protein|nr:hypothetical protein [Thermoproteota archaeon]
MVEDVIIRYGRFEVNPKRLEKNLIKHGLIQEIDDEERERIIQCRKLYLEWMHLHFARKVAKPPHSE